MTTDQEEATALLASVAGTERRTREFLVYARAGDYMILWGILWVVGFAFSDRLGAHTRTLWLCLDAIGFAGTAYITWRAVSSREPGSTARNVALRTVVASLTFMGFGTLWVDLAHFGWREQSAFWPSFVTACLFVLGLWAGRAFSIVGALLFATTMAGYFFLGPWLDLWLAVTCGGALIAGGFWLRR
ncbi:MAG TPA: hypothetical protein VG387_16030 [Rhizomicrobium sp.]|jgi:hypothetical protein|nr:hypothetical protein [Rhizomicrobium sp.]